MVLLNLINGFLTNSTNEDVIAVNQFIEDLKGDQNVEKIRILLKGLIEQAESFASTHTTFPAVHFNYSDILYDKNINFDAVYTFDYPDSLEEYIATLKEMLNSLSSNGTYQINYSYDTEGVINEIFINGQNNNM